MSFLGSMDISASALTATRLRMDVIAENMANVQTTRTEDGGPYRRKYVVYEAVESDSFASYLGRSSASSSAGGVRVVEIGEDQSELKYDYDPEHPDADEDGYVALPNVDVVTEMVDMMSAYRAYEANITAFNTFKDMALKTLELGN